MRLVGSCTWAVGCVPSNHLRDFSDRLR